MEACPEVGTLLFWIPLPPPPPRGTALGQGGFGAVEAFLIRLRLGWGALGGFSECSYVICEHCSYIAVGGNPCLGPSVKPPGTRDRLVARVSVGACTGHRSEVHRARTFFQLLRLYNFQGWGGTQVSSTFAQNRSLCFQDYSCLGSTSHCRCGEPPFLSFYFLKKMGLDQNGIYQTLLVEDRLV